MKIVSVPNRQSSNLIYVHTPDPNNKMRAQIPEWYYYSPFGQPRNVNISGLRDLARIPACDIPVTTLTDEFARLKSKIVPIDEGKFSEKDLAKAKKFFKFPNKNKETETHLKRAWVRDLLQVDAGAITKVFKESSYKPSRKESFNMNIHKGLESKGGFIDSLKQKDMKVESHIKEIQKEFQPLKPFGERELEQMYVRDASTFQMDGDVTGFVHRYYQYSFKIPKKEPLIFDRDEITYSMKYPRSFSFYGWSVIQSMEQILLSIKSQTEYTLGYYREKGIPDAVLSVLDSNKVELSRLKEHWRSDSIGSRRKFAIIGRDVKFTPMVLTSKDMEVLATQQWLFKVAMAMYHVNIPIITLRGDAPKAGIEGLTQEEKMKALAPLIYEWETKMNMDIIPELLQKHPDEVDIKYEIDVYSMAEDERNRNMQIADLNANVVTINEIRAERGLEPVAWGNVPQNIFVPLEGKGDKDD